MGQNARYNLLMRFLPPRSGEPKAQIETDLKLFFNNLNSLSTDNGDNFSIPAAISGARIGFFGFKEWLSYFLAERGKASFRLDEIEFEKLATDTARVKISYVLSAPNNVGRADGQPVGPAIRVIDKVETLDLKREGAPFNQGEKWLIVPSELENLKSYDPLSIAHIAYFASTRAGVLSQLRGQLSLSRLKQTSMGVMQFLQDYDERYRFENEFWREAVLPYVKNGALLLIPGSGTPYTFNDNLSDKSIAAINEVAQTVLFYEGSDEKPIFRYDGKAAICFTDGHVALLTPDEAKTLIWRP